jgi:hypothetical protein
MINQKSFTHVTRPEKFSRQPHKKHELFVRKFSFIRDIGEVGG